MNITHVNHSSLYIEGKNSSLLTDPWIFKNAFGGWYQYPYPHTETVKKILTGKNNLDIVIISHAHDDHIDEELLIRLNQKTKIIIPKTNNKGLINRLTLFGIDRQQIIEIGEDAVDLNGFNIAAIQDGNLTDEDFIFVISNERSTIVHANDNWREFRKETINKINHIFNANNSSEKLLFSQVGIADAYPIFYDGISIDEKKNIISKKLNYMCKSVLINMAKLSIAQGFIYANQSKFSMNSTKFDPYKLKDQIIEKYKIELVQLMPSDQIIGNEYKKTMQNKMSILDTRLRHLEDQFALYKKSHKLNLMPIKFHTYESEIPDLKSISISALPSVWNEILRGKLNIESIITGGLGKIYKPHSYNMKDEYIHLVKWTYRQQKQSKQDLTLPPFS